MKTNLSSELRTLERRGFLNALKLGHFGFVSYFSKIIPEPLLRAQTRETASVLLAEEFTRLQIPPKYLRSLIKDKKIILEYNKNQSIKSIMFSDSFIESTQLVSFRRIDLKGYNL